MNGKKIRAEVRTRRTCSKGNSRPYGRIVIVTNGSEKLKVLRPDCPKKINNDSKMGKMRNE